MALSQEELAQRADHWFRIMIEEQRPITQAEEAYFLRGCDVEDEWRLMAALAHRVDLWKAKPPTENGALRPESRHLQARLRKSLAELEGSITKDENPPRVDQLHPLAGRADRGLQPAAGPAV
jgi:hypothetical protein